MRVTFKTVAGRPFALETSPNEKVTELKTRIAADHSYDEGSIKFVVNGSIVSDSHTVEEACLDTFTFVVLVAKKKAAVAAVAAGNKKKEKEIEDVLVPISAAAPEGPLSQQQITGLVHLQKLMEGKVKNTKDFTDLLRLHGTVTEVRVMVQADQQQLGPILYQIHYYAPELLVAINQHQQEFLALINEPILRRPSTSEGSEFGFDYMVHSTMGPAVVYITQEEEEAIQRLAALGFSQQMAAEAFIITGRREDLAAGYLWEAFEQVHPQEAEIEWVPDTVAVGNQASRAPPAEKREGGGGGGSGGGGHGGAAPPPPVMSSSLPKIQDPAVNPYHKLQQALVAQGKIEESLVVAEQARIDANAGGSGDALYHLMRTLPLSQQSQSNKGEYFLNIADVRRIVTASNMTLVYYSILPHIKRLFIWMIPPRSSKHIEFRQVAIDPEQLEGSMVTLRRSLARNSGINPRTVWRRVLKQLHALLVEPIEEVLPSVGETVCFIPAEGQMGLLPFPALLSPQGNFLVTRHPVVVTHSLHMLATTLHHAAKPRPKGRGSPVAVGNGAGMTSLQPQTVAVESLSSLQLTGCPVLQLQAQPQARDTYPLQDLLCNRHPKVECLADVCVIPPNNPDKTVMHDDIWEVARALLAGGVSSVVLPMWDLKSDDQQRVLHLFYEALRQGSSTATALQQAMLKVQQLPDVDIWTWAGWALVGPPVAPFAVAPTKTSNSPSKSSKGKKSSQRAADYQYLKNHRIHLLYENLVRELVQARPENAAQFVLEYMQSHPSP